MIGPIPPNGPHNPPVEHNPAAQWHPQGAFYLNQMEPPRPPKKPFSPWWAALIAVGIIAVIGIIGVATSGDDSASPTTAKATAYPTYDPDGMGTPAGDAPDDRAEVVTVNLGESLTLTSEFSGDTVIFTLAAGKPISRTKYGTKPEKGQFFALTATVQVTQGSAYAYGGDFALIAKDGTVYEAGMSHAVDGGLEGAEVRSGQKVSGLVVWDIPAGVQAGAKVELREGGAGGDQGFWQLP